jgi:hypothetical protein
MTEEDSGRRDYPVTQSLSAPDFPSVSQLGKKQRKTTVFEEELEFVASPVLTLTFVNVRL